MNGVSVLKVKSAMIGVQCSFLSGRILSKHLLHTQSKGSNFIFSYVEAYVIDIMYGAYFGV